MPKATSRANRSALQAAHNAAAEALLAKYPFPLEAFWRVLKDTTSEGSTDIAMAVVNHYTCGVHRRCSKYEAKAVGGDSPFYKEGVTPLMLAAYAGRDDVLKALLDSGADVRSYTEDGYTALCAAVAANSLSTISLLVAAGADVNASNQRGRGTSLHVAAKLGRCEAMALLVKKGAKVNSRAGVGETPLLVAVSSRAVDSLKALVALGADVNIPDRRWNLTPLHLAVGLGDIPMTKILLAHNAKVDAVDKDGTTPLYQAFLSSCASSATTARLLLSAGATLNGELYVSNRYKEPLMHAAAMSDAKTVAVCLDFGADVNGVTREGLSVLDSCNEMDNRTAVRKLLLAEGAETGEVIMQRRAATKKTVSSLSSPTHFLSFVRNQVAWLLAGILRVILFYV